MHLHILGICGTFMGGLAALAREAGHRVTGCDANVYPPMSDQLRALGIELIEGYTADQTRLAPDLYVIGNVVSRGNALMEAILEAGAAYTSGPQWLSEHILQGRHVLAVAGTHGKTTTTSMLAWILEEAGLAPGFLVGGVPGNFGISARLGGRAAPKGAGGASAPSGGSAAPQAASVGARPAAGPSQGGATPSGGSAAPKGASVGAPSTAGPSQGASAPSGGSAAPKGASVGALFVIEADEYDTAFFDKRSKFVHYRPRTAILNNLEYDHADIFPDLAAIETQFHHLVRTVPASGRLVVNARDEALARVLGRGVWSDVQRFGSAREEPGTLRARGEPHTFDVLRGSTKVAHVEWELLGEHNQLNALAAIAAAEHVGVAPADAARALGRFANVKRRMELRGEAGGVRVYDDFAHHPTAMRLTIDGLRRKVGHARILAVFEPRSNTMKLGSMKAQLPWALEEADLSFCFSGNLGWDAAEALAPMGHAARVSATLDALVRQVVSDSRPGDHILVMSNGGFGGVHDKLLAALSAARPQASA